MPGKSLVFATMELLMSVLARHMPHLSAKMSESPSRTAPRARLSEESARLVAATVSILSDLPSLCSPAGESPPPRGNGPWPPLWWQDQAGLPASLQPGPAQKPNPRLLRLSPEMPQAWPCAR